MPAGSVSNNYNGALGSFAEIDDGFDRYLLVYKNTGSAVTNGDVYFFSFIRDTDSLAVAARPTLEAVATSAVTRQIAVVNNFPFGQSTIAAGAWGYVQLRGYCPDCNTSGGSVAIERFLKGSNGATTAIDDGATITANSFAIMVSAVFNTSHFQIEMFGKEVAV